MFKWDSAQYTKFEKERSLPAIDLANAITAAHADTVLDIGCGIGNSTAVLAKRFPGAEIIGADNSGDMLEAAAKNHPGIKFIRLDAGKDLEKMDARFDVVFSNACIQWIPDHKKLLKNMFSLLKDGGTLAVQTPQQSKHPVHQILKRLAASEKWSGKISGARVYQNLEEGEYFDVLSSLGGDFRMWETVYFHKMPSHQSIIEWYKGTGLRPFLSQLCDLDKEEFLSDVLNCIKREYPIQKNGEIIFRFPRLFFTCTK